MTYGSVITYPIPAYQNVPIEPQNYRPRKFDIDDIALGQTTTVTSIDPMDYVIGQSVRLIIPKSCGAFELNNATGVVISVPNQFQVVLNIYSRGGNEFTFDDNGLVKPQIIAIGDYNSGSTNLTDKMQTTYIQGSFINISPQ